MRETGDIDAFHTYTARRMVGYVYTLIGDLAEAEDTVQEPYVKARQHWPKVSRYENPEAWVRTVSYRIAVSSWRRAMSRQRAYRRHGPPPDVPGLDTDHVALADRVTPRQPGTATRGRAAPPGRVDGGGDLAGNRAPTGTIKARLARGRVRQAAEPGAA
jgi:RNA polymerase sigma-70 factor (ECF subfamily)